MRIFIPNHLPDQAFDTLGGCLFAGTIIDPAGEEEFKFKDTVGGLDVFIGSSPAYRGFVHINYPGHLF